MEQRDHFNRRFHLNKDRLIKLVRICYCAVYPNIHAVCRIFLVSLVLNDLLCLNFKTNLNETIFIASVPALWFPVLVR